MYFINKLDNNIRLVMQKIDNVNSVSLGIIVENGSTNEDETNNGISHFIEHMLFRGTVTKTAKDISSIIDNIGGNLNAFTSKENTCFYAQILNYHLDIVIDLLSDIFLNPSFDRLDIEKEKKVIEEEINMYLDDPEDLVHELLNELIYENTSLSRPILGSIQSIKKFNSEILSDYFNDNYTQDKIIISLAGDIDMDKAYIKLNQTFGRLKRNSNSRYTTNLENINIFNNNKINSINKDVEQFNLCIGLPGPSSYSNDIYSYLILNNILANNESSRLQQSIREEGLAYSIYSNINSYKSIGDISIYMGINNNQIKNVLSIIDSELDKLSSHYISHDELEIGKEQLKINYILESESSISKMFENAKSIALFGKIETQDEILKKIDIINKNDIVELINNLFKRDKMNVSYVCKNYKRKDLEKQIKKKMFRGV